MSRKVTPADRYRQALMGAVGEASLDFSGYCRLAAQAMLQSAMEVEAADFIGRGSRWFTRCCWTSRSGGVGSRSARRIWKH